MRSMKTVRAVQGRRLERPDAIKRKMFDHCIPEKTLTTLYDLIADMVGKDMEVNIPNAMAAKITPLVVASPIMTL